MSSNVRPVSLQPLKTWRISSLTRDENEGTTELDSHADTCVVGSNALVLHDSIDLLELQVMIKQRRLVRSRLCQLR